MTVVIDGRKITGLTRIYNELGASTPEAMQGARSCLNAGRPYKGHTIMHEVPETRPSEPGARPAGWW